MAGTRARYSGTQDELQAAIAPYVKDVRCLQYKEKSDEQIMPEVLVAHKQLIRSLTHVCPNLSCSRKQVQEVFEEIQKEKQFKELFNKDLQSEWVEVMSKRLYMVCRHVAQSRLRQPGPKWLALIDNEGGQMSSMSDVGDPAAGHPPEQKEEKEEEQRAAPSAEEEAAEDLGA